MIKMTIIVILAYQYCCYYSLIPDHPDIDLTQENRTQFIKEMLKKEDERLTVRPPVYGPAQEVASADFIFDFQLRF